MIKKLDEIVNKIKGNKDEDILEQIPEEIYGPPEMLEARNSKKTIKQAPVCIYGPPEMLEERRRNSTAQKVPAVLYGPPEVMRKLLRKDPAPIEMDKSYSKRNFCCNCGYHLEENFVFCPICGEKIPKEPDELECL